MVGKDQSSDPSAPPLLQDSNAAAGKSSALFRPVYRGLSGGYELTPYRFLADSDMNVPLVNSPDSASPQQIIDYTPDPAIASAAVESEQPNSLTFSLQPVPKLYLMCY